MNDLIRRSDVLRVLNEAVQHKGVGAAIAGLLIQYIETIPTVRPGATLEPMVVENPEWKLYTKCHGDKAVEYRYGPEWVSMELLMEGGYKTPEEAKLRWLEYWEAQK